MIHRLDGVLTENLHGWFDSGLEPLLRIASGDSVVYRTADSGWDDRAPDKAETGRRRPEGAGHALAGPIWIEGAEPGNSSKFGSTRWWFATGGSWFTGRGGPP